MNAQVPSYVPTNGLVGYWGFNGNANDSSGNGHDGTVNGATLTTDRFGNANSAYSFNGSTSYIAVPHNAAFNMQKATWNVWVKISAASTGNGYYIFGKRDNAQHHVNFYESAGNGRAIIGWTTNQASSVGTANIVGNWHLLTLTYDQSLTTNNLNSYLDGVYYQSTTVQPFSFLNGDIRFGIEANFNYWQAFSGLIDDASIYNRILSQTEIQQLYTGTVAVTNCPSLSGTLTNGLVAYYPFCGNANDASGNNNNGTVNGASLTTDRFGNSNSAYNFNGTSNYIDLGINSAINSILGDFSISYWIKPESSGGCVLSSCSTSNVNGWRIISRLGGGNSTAILGAVSTEFLVTPTWQASVTPGNVINNSQWNHVLFTRNGTATKIYCNGLLVYTGTFSSANINNPANTITKIGCNFATGLGEFITGKIDDFAIYNRALSPDEVSSLYGQNICYQSVTVTDTLIINTGILSYNPITYNNTITIYPNPANDHITIDCGTLANVVGYSIKIVNTLGQEVFNQPMNTQQYYIPLNSWSGQGMYFVNLIDAQGHTIDIKKIILQ